MARRSILILTIVAALVVAMAWPASASTFRRSYVWNNSAATSLQFNESGDGVIRTMSSIRLALQAPRAGGCYSARMLIDGITRLSGGTVCDGNGDGHFTWWLGTLSAYPNDRVTAWFSDPWSSYAEAHPTIVL